MLVKFFSYYENYNRLFNKIKRNFTYFKTIILFSKNDLDHEYQKLKKYRNYRPR